MAVFRLILIHGTWAPGSTWTRAGSTFRTKLRLALEDKGHQVAFDKAIVWGGRNWIAARRRGASELEKHLREIRPQEPDVRRVVIGHSHGGSAIAYALKESFVAQHLHGACFLATPFIDVRPQPNWSGVFQVLLFLLMTTAWVTVFLFTGILLPWGMLDTAITLWVIGGGLILWLVIYLFVKYRQALQQRLEDYLERLCERNSTSRLPALPALYVRSPGDEAAGVLAFAHIVSIPAYRILAFLSNLVMPPVSVLMRTWSAGRLFKALIVLALIGFALGCVAAAAHIIACYPIPLAGDECPSPDPNLIQVLVSVPPNYLGALVDEAPLFQVPLWNTFLYAAAFLFATFAAILLTLSIIFAALFLSAFALLLIAYVFFGSGQWLAGPFLEYAVEPLPQGAHTLHRLDWPDQRQRYFGLSHSHPYASDEAIDLICQWLCGLQSHATTGNIAVR